MLKRKRFAAIMLLVLLASFVLFCTAAEVYSLRPHNCCHSQSCGVCAAAAFATETLFRSSGKAVAVTAAVIFSGLITALLTSKTRRGNNAHFLYKIRLLI